ncbi:MULTISPECIES: hypothetical protein [Burkholderia]|uniref:hypothetical protein n=1 Tax=Burkholderia TaxID=32008 RepID=UPI000F603412|nr:MULTISPECIES: hypothetical protein [Burkholderia]RQZ74803.1 hypothetical protein DF052_06870 [Burkholderia glumae]
MEKKKHPAIAVASKADSFRRAGHAFSRAPQTIALAALHPDAHRAIVEDQSLVVVPSTIELTDAQAAELKHHDADHVIEALKHVDTLQLQVSEDDAKRALALADIERDLQEREKALANREGQLKLAEAELESNVGKHAENLAALDRREAELKERAAELAEREAKLAEGEKSAGAGRNAGKQHSGR